ncbi:MAG: TonB-dependent receptor [Ignavibacteriaceae bacterium]|nr:TonB-dependent receptor [Ignavibacteriaceae bacterium]
MKSKIFISVLLLLGNLFSQTKIKIEGNVFDEDKKPLPMVMVFLSNSGDGVMSDEQGKFSFLTKLKDKIILNANLIGYEKFSKELDLQDQKKITLDIELKESALKMKESVVSASSFGSEKGKGLVLSRIDVLTTPGGAADLFQSLKTMPGITQVSESAELYVRGGDPIETITMIDQALIYHPFSYESTYGSLFSNLKNEFIKGMYFSSGGFSAKFGNVLSGVLDIETKGVPALMHSSLGISLANTNFSTELPIIEDKLGFNFNFDQSFTKPIFWLNGGLEKFTAAPTSKNITGSVNYAYSKTGKLKLFGIYARDIQGVSVEGTEYQGTFDGNTQSKFINLQHSNVLFSKLVMKNSFSVSNYSNQWKLGVLDLLKTDKVYSFRNDFEYFFNSRSRLLSGIELENRKLNYLGQIPNSDYNIRPDAQKKVLDANIFGSRIGGYLELESANTFGINNFASAIGIRYDRIPSLNLDWINPRLNFSYKLNEHSTLKTALGIFNQLPDPRLFSSVDGNPNLKSMKAVHYVLSYDYLFDEDNSFRIELYHKDYKNLPLETSLLNYDNNGKGFANGVDVILKSTLTNGWSGWISYGFISTKRKWMDFEELTSSSFDITHNFSLIAKYFIAVNWQVGINLKYATGRPYTPVIGSDYRLSENVYEPVYGVKNSSRFQDYKRLDLRLTYFTTLFDSFSSVFYLEGLNILDLKNIFGYYYSPDYSERKEISSYFGRRTVVVGASFSF